ncbi:MAG: inositol monophosphatase [Deltaproteobacteria bacterium]|nr:inositol monophosphatase [Deltaproteobacteria bacterium]
MDTAVQGIEELTEFAMQVIQEAGKAALPYYGKARPGERFDEELVTKAELHLTELFQDRLSDRFPEHQLFVNNQEDVGYSHEDKRYLWVFDPLDGVANFQGGIPLWGISLALLENSWPVFGTFHMPATGDLFHARAGETAFWGEQKIHAVPFSEINEESVLLTYARFNRHYRPSFAGKIRSFGCTSAHMCYVAAGRAEAAIIAREAFQDLAAGRIIIEAAGLKIYKMDGSELFLNEYLNGKEIEEHLLVVSSESRRRIHDCLEPI